MAEVITIPAAPPPARTTRAWLVPLVLYCLGHFLVDLYQGSIGVLQPILVDRFRLSFSEAGILGGAFVCSSSMVQPLYGYLCDRFRSRLFSALGPIVTAIFICSLGRASGFGSLLLMVIVAGVGVAAYHPQAASNAIAAIQRNRARAMAIFVGCGSLGWAAGPVFLSFMLNRVGLDRLLWGIIPGVFATLLLLGLLPPVVQKRNAREKADWNSLLAVWKPMTILLLLVMIRSVVQVTFGQFLPLYLHTVRQYSLSEASLSLTLYLACGAIGGFAGGTLADRFGGRLIIIFSMIGSVPLLALFVFAQGAWSIAGLLLGGLVLLFTMPINIVMAQELAPTQAGTVSALMMGFAWGCAGFIFIPLTGWISDVFSMQWAFVGLSLIPVLGFLLALKLPRDLDWKSKT
jgi:FSR family fosmidomycin resistance protein-like MFS transporter